MMYARQTNFDNDQEALVDIDTEFVRQQNLYKALDNINGYDELDANMINYVLDESTYCFENYAKKDDVCWVNTRTRETHELDPAVLRDNFLAFFGGKAEQATARLRKKRRFAVFAYNPYTTAIEYVANGKRCFNTYHPPAWKLEEHPAQLPEKIDMFMRHLFPKDDSREYVYDWLANGLKSRNLTYLYLLSTQGAGKGLFSNIVMALFGKSNFTKAGQTFITKEFNAYVKDKQVVVFNEITAKEAEGLDKLKTLVDDTIMIEGKTKDIFENANHLNVIITVNRPDAIEIEDNDRRYSIVHMSPKPLKDAYEAREVAEFAEMYKSGEIIGQFGHWLMSREIERNMLQKYVDEEKMHEIDNELMFNWQKFIANEVCQYKTKLTNPFTSKDLNDLMVETGLIDRHIGWNKIHAFITAKCGDVLRCRRNKENPAILDIEFINPKRNKDDGIPF